MNHRFSYFYYEDELEIFRKAFVYNIEEFEDLYPTTVEVTKTAIEEAKIKQEDEIYFPFEYTLKKDIDSISNIDFYKTKGYFESLGYEVRLSESSKNIPRFFYRGYYISLSTQEELGVTREHLTTSYIRSSGNWGGKFEKENGKITDVFWNERLNEFVYAVIFESDNRVLFVPFESVENGDFQITSSRDPWPATN